MFKIEGTTLYLTRGDTAYLSVDFNDDIEIANLVFSAKKQVSDADYAIQISAIGNKFIFEPKDTKELEYGKYFYDIQLTTVYGEIFTVVEKANLYIREEITV